MTVLTLCEIYSLGLAVFHLFFWKIFHWKEDLKTASVPTRAIIQIANLRLIWLFLLTAYLCFAYPEALRTSPLGKAFLAGMSLFWLGRTIEQFIFLRYNRVFVHVLTGVFTLGTILFTWPLLEKQMNPTQLVEEQLEGYNAHNIDRFCAVYADDVVVYSLKDEKVLFTGIEAFRKNYETLFKDSPALNAKIKNRMALGDFVIDQEEVTGRRGQDLKAIAIYRITGGKISHVWFAL